MAKYIKTEEGYKELEQIGAATTESVSHAQATAETAKTTAETAQTTASNALVETNKVLTATSKKMDANNPTGTGSISINRKDDTLIGQNSTAIGTNTVAKAANQLTTGQYNIYSPISYIPTNLLNYAKRVTVRVKSGYRIIYSKKCYINDDYNGVLVECGNLYGPSNNMRDFAEAVVNLYNEIGAFWFVYGNYNPSSSFIERRNVIYYYDNTNSPIFATDQDMAWDSYSLSDFNFEVVTHDLNNYAYVVGNGTSDTDRSNAHTLDWDGNAWFSGDVYVGSTSGTNKDEGSKKLATEEYVNEKCKDGGGESAGKWRLLNDITTKEEIAANTGISLSAADDGTPYNLKEVVFLWFCPAASQSAYATFKVNGRNANGTSPDYFSSGGFFTNADRKALCTIKALGDAAVLKGNVGINGYGSNGESVNVVYNYAGAFETITSIDFTVFGNVFYPAGLKITIWGLEA